MSILTVRSLKKDFGIKEIVRDASFTLVANDKVGLIGTNGSGKSTLLKMVAGLESKDSGDLQTPSGTRIVYLPQQPVLNESLTVLEQIFADSGEKMQLVRDYEAVSEALTHCTGDTTALLDKLGSLSEQMDAAGAWELETNAKIVLSKLGITDLTSLVGDLSGGYRKRISIASALLSEPDILLMDEPTNHLDALSVEWLQSYLSRYRGVVLLITHDRYFLDRVTNRILELDRGELYNYDGNYSYYLEKKAEAEESNASSQRKFQGVLRRELEWLKQGPKARSTKQRARIQRIDGMKETEFKQALGKVEISTVGRRIGKKVIVMENLTKGFGDRTLIKDFTYEFSPEDRIGIIGGNGAGKTTLMNLITGRLAPDSGTIEIGQTIKIGYFDQHSEDLLDDRHSQQRTIDYLKDVAELIKTTDGSIITASQMLERFLFTPNQQYAPVNLLSGGERRRLFLLRVLMEAPNVLILDEPTNDVDVQTLAVLEEYLEDFNGCVIVVSHDRYFLDRTIETVFSLEEGGEIRQYPGNYSVYLDYKQAEQDQVTADGKAAATKVADQKVADQKAADLKAPPAAPTAPRGRKMSFKEKRELETLEAQIPKLEAEKTALEQTLYNNPPSGFGAVQTLTDQLTKLTTTIETSTERWMALTELAEQSA
jgi:ABC transport system ATP-binding/permease protein